MKALLPFRFVRCANGMANHEGTKLADYTSLDYGRPIERRIAFDGDINLVIPFLTLPDTPVTGQTTIALSSALLDTDQLKGMQIAIALPEYGEFWVETVLSNTTATIVVDDASYLIYSGIDEGLSFVVYDFVDTNVHTSGGYHTAGTWTSAPGYGSSVTTFTDSGADFQAHMIGWLVSPTVESFAYLEIIDVTATTLTVSGDARGLASNGGRYWVFAPPHVNPANGAIRGEYDDDLFIPACDTRYLWALYRYMPPMAGFEVDLDGPGGDPAAIYGRQTGTNQSGHHHMWSHVYDIAMGRWTTPRAPLDPGPSIYLSVEKKKCCVHWAAWVTEPKSPATLNANGDGTFRLQVPFQISFAFTDSGECKCSCCEVRQYVKGEFKQDGVVMDKYLKADSDGSNAVKLEKNTYKEDGGVFPDGKDAAGKDKFVSKRYGHRSDSGEKGNEYYDVTNVWDGQQWVTKRNQASGCRYLLNDAPGFNPITPNKGNGGTAIKYEFNLDFKVEVIDTCNNNKSVAFKGGGAPVANQIDLPKEFNTNGSTKK